MIVIIFRIIRTTSTIILIIIMNRYSKSIRSSYKSCFLHCLFCEKKKLFNSVIVRVDVICCF